VAVFVTLAFDEADSFRIQTLVAGFSLVNNSSGQSQNVERS